MAVSTTLKMAVLAPMPSANVTIAMAVKPGVLRIVRPAYLRSCNNESIQPNPPMLRVTSLTKATLPNSRRAARAASSGASPRSILCLVSIARWA